MFLRLAAAATVSMGLAAPVQAQNIFEYADPQVVQALNELLQVYGNVCQAGYQDGCQVVQVLQQEGGRMLRAGYECQTQNNQQACQFYNSAYGELEQAYSQTQQTLQQGQFAGMQQGGYDGSTHDQRMQAIQNWGQERLDYGRQQSNMMDLSHQRALDAIRQ